MYDYTFIPGPTSPDVCSGATLSCAHQFNRFFSDKVWDFLVVEINQFAAQSVISSLQPCPWHDVTIPEMKTFIGVLITTEFRNFRILSCIRRQILAPGHQAILTKKCLSSSSGFFTSMTVLYKILLDILSIATFSR